MQIARKLNIVKNYNERFTKQEKVGKVFDGPVVPLYALLLGLNGTLSTTTCFQNGPLQQCIYFVRKYVCELLLTLDLQSHQSGDLFVEKATTAPPLALPIILW